MKKINLELKDKLSLNNCQSHIGYSFQSQERQELLEAIGSAQPPQVPRQKRGLTRLSQQSGLEAISSILSRLPFFQEGGES